MAFALNLSSDGRIMTQSYLKDGAMMFCVAEPIPKGTLITEFDSDGQVANQTCKQEKEAVPVLNEYLGLDDFELVNVSDYKGVRIGAKCGKCASIGLSRQLDELHPSKISEVPVVPIFVCIKCKQRHYSLTNRYLNLLVTYNNGLFSNSELEEIRSDKEASISELNEYIIRIFASKKISKIVLR